MNKLADFKLGAVFTTGKECSNSDAFLHVPEGLISPAFDSNREWLESSLLIQTASGFDM